MNLFICFQGLLNRPTSAQEYKILWNCSIDVFLHSGSQCNSSYAPTRKGGKLSLWIPPPDLAKLPAREGSCACGDRVPCPRLPKRNNQNAPATHRQRGWASTAKPPRKKLGRRWIGLAVVSLALALLVGLLPTLFVHTPLLAYAIRRAALLDGGIRFQSASIGWFSSTTVSNVVISDAQGETVLEMDNVTCDRSFLKLLFQHSNLGTLGSSKPRLNVKLSHDGSNVEAVLAHWLTATSNSSSRRRRSVAGRRQWRCHNRGCGRPADVAPHRPATRPRLSRKLAWPPASKRRSQSMTGGMRAALVQVASDGQRRPARRPGRMVRPGGHRRRREPANDRTAVGHAPLAGGTRPPGLKLDGTLIRTWKPSGPARPT